MTLPLTDRDRAALATAGTLLADAIRALPERGDLIGVLLIREQIECLASDLGELLTDSRPAAAGPGYDRDLDAELEPIRSDRQDAAAGHPKAAGEPNEKEQARGWYGVNPIVPTPCGESEFGPRHYESEC